MPLSRADRQAIGSIGGLTRAALAPDLASITQPARDARWQKYVDQVPAEVTDPDERERRAGMLLQADMARLSLRASRARKLRAEAERIEAELAESGNADDGADGSTGAP